VSARDDPAGFLREHGPAALEWAASYFDRVAELPVLSQVAPGQVRDALPERAPEGPGSFAEVLHDLDSVLLSGVTHWQHPRYFAYFPSGTSGPAVLAEMLAAALNSNAILWRTAPASTELEGVVCRWVAELLGLPEGWHGHIEDSASTGLMLAAIAAREATGRNVLVCSAQTHSSAQKAARMLGMELRVVPCDESFRLDLAELGRPADAALVVATVGTTGSAAVDPVPAIADACDAAGAWLHVDAAYAGTAMVCPEFRWAFAGVERAASVVVNAHKWMLTPVDCSLFWCSRTDALRAAFSLIPEYLRTPDPEDALSLSEYGPALGRRWRSLKLWAVLRCLGRTGLIEHVRSGVALAAEFEQWVRAEPGWELVGDRHFSLVCFRLAGAGAQADERNRRLLEAVNASGVAFLSHAVLADRYTLRLAVGGPLTTLEDMRLTWDALREHAQNPYTE
jgi:aromatic-L-amino-acid decarboxylase